MAYLHEFLLWIWSVNQGGVWLGLTSDHLHVLITGYCSFAIQS